MGGRRQLSAWPNTEHVPVGVGELGTTVPVCEPGHPPRDQPLSLGRNVASDEISVAGAAPTSRPLRDHHRDLVPPLEDWTAVSWHGWRPATGDRRLAREAIAQVSTRSGRRGGHKPPRRRPGHQHGRSRHFSDLSSLLIELERSARTARACPTSGCVLASAADSQDSGRPLTSPDAAARMTGLRFGRALPRELHSTPTPSSGSLTTWKGSEPKPLWMPSSASQQLRSRAGSYRFARRCEEFAHASSLRIPVINE